jgi:hypothetical protein
MRKLTLKADALRVESFLPVGAPGDADRGTVRANAGTVGETCSLMGSCPTYEETCTQTCGPTCSLMGSCPTHEETCKQTCGPTCSLMGSCPTYEETCSNTTC